MAKRILGMGTYPISMPRHGGQLRVKALFDAYEAGGFTCRYLCFYDPAGYPQEVVSEWSVPFDMDAMRGFGRSGQRPDIYSAEFACAPSRLDAVLNSIARFKPDVITLEQPWLWPLAQAYLNSPNRRRPCQIVYSSQNDEGAMVRQRTDVALDSVSPAAIFRVDALEQDLLANAALTIAVSAPDAAVFSRRCATTAVIGNGIAPPARNGGWDYWCERFCDCKVAVFIGSAHPPNASGFMAMVGPSLAYLAPDCKVVVIGGVGHILDRVESYSLNHGLLHARAEILGVQDEGGLATLLQLAQVILLPITQGGGTNLKTAEALVSGKPILATSSAFRGYEQYATLERVSISDDPADFKRKLAAILMRPAARVDAQQPATQLVPADAAGLLWSNVLRGLPNLMMSVVERASRRAVETAWQVRFDSETKFRGIHGIGWNDPDWWGMWSCVEGATLAIDLDLSPGNGADIEIEWAAYVADGEDKELTILVANRPLYTAVVSPSQVTGSTHFSLDFKDQDENGDIVFLFKVSKLHVPTGEAAGYDNRRLGFCLRSLVARAVLF